MKNILWKLAFTLILVSFVLPTAIAADGDEEDDKTAASKDSDGETDDEKQDADDDAKKKEKAKEKRSTKGIPGLVEMRIDEKVISARALNLPIPGSTHTVQELLEHLDEWSQDDDVGGILLDLGQVALSMADVEELRGAIGEARDSGKKIVSFLNGGGPSAYLLACATDEVAIAPTGAMEIPGVGSLFQFQKGYLQMQGIEYQVIAAGKYKYPGFLTRREPDKYFSEEYGAILDTMFEEYVDIIAKGRELKPEKVRELIDKGLFSATQAQQNDLVDELSYYDDYRDRVLQREKMRRHRKTSDGLEDLTSIQDIMEWMNDRMQESAKSSKAVGPKIAVLHARGPIVNQNLGAAAASQMICRDDFVKVVDELRKNKSIKAVVLRIDSPGGSGYASDVIWRQLRKLGEVKPLVASMGTVAGSGGYYIACPARKIFAQPTTMTGSIGVISMMASQRSAFNRMDVELAEMSRGKMAMLGAPHRALTGEEKKVLQDYISDFYDIFIDRVATTRKRPESEVRKIAEGRIWSGRDAKEIGLVDEVGGLHQAIESARRMANIPASAELKVVHYPRAGSLGEILDSLSPLSASTPAVEAYWLASQPASLSFRQQLSLLTTKKLQPLCWMATPETLLPGHVTMPNQLLPVLDGKPRLDVFPTRN